jgi:YHS domain-containing protein
MKSELSLRVIATIALFSFVTIFAGCAANPQADTRSAPATKPACAECLVCKKNFDLACVDVDVDATTPRTEYNGKTYYFCSDDCKQEFLKNPSKYASSK